MIDLLIVVLALLFAANGFRQGLILSVASFFGFFGGAVLGSQLAGPVANAVSTSLFAQVFLALLVVLGVAFLGQIGAVWVGQRLRQRLTWRPARHADAVLGAVVSALAVLLVAWMIATPLASSAFPNLAREVRESTLVGAVDQSVPSPVRSLYDSLRELIDRRGLPDVLDPLTPTIVMDVPTPDPDLVDDPIVVAASEAVVKVTGVAPDCSRRVDGSGFVYAEDRVMTNAHVLAGVREPQVSVSGQELDATPVFVDELLDVAILAVPDLDVTPLAFATVAVETGDDAIITGYPGGGPLYVGAARIRDRALIAGPDFRDTTTVEREVYSLRGEVRAGNSGGPLLDTDGTVLGVVFASAVDDPSTGYALTAEAVSQAADVGVAARQGVGTGDCE
ncbi:MAG: MarP family serine protease [Geodermatophilaceae bacterium]|nr:MarP family serine protease [Geodermatophilaceae bacterium]